MDLLNEVQLRDDIDLVACRKYGEIDRPLDPKKPESFLEGPHLCALQIYEPNEVATNPASFIRETRDLLVRLVPLWKLYSGTVK